MGAGAKGVHEGGGMERGRIPGKGVASDVFVEPFFGSKYSNFVVLRCGQCGVVWTSRASGGEGGGGGADVCSSSKGGGWVGDCGWVGVCGVGQLFGF